MRHGRPRPAKSVAWMNRARSATSAAQHAVWRARKPFVAQPTASTPPILRRTSAHVSARSRQTLRAAIRIVGIFTFAPWLTVVIVSVLGLLGPAAGAAVLTAVVAIALVAYLIRNPGNMAAAFVWTLGIVVVAGVGAGIWVAARWLVAGIAAWWRWLGGHF